MKIVSWIDDFSLLKFLIFWKSSFEETIFHLQFILIGQNYGTLIKNPQFESKFSQKGGPQEGIDFQQNTVDEK